MFLEKANSSGMFAQRFYPLRHCANKESLNDRCNTVTNALSGLSDVALSYLRQSTWVKFVWYDI